MGVTDGDRDQGEIVIPEPSEPLPQGDIDDDRHNINAQDKVLLIIEDDATFAQTVLGMARDKGFKGVIALRGTSDSRWRAVSCRARSCSTSSCP